MGLLRSDKKNNKHTFLVFILCLTCFFSACSFSEDPVLITDQNGNKKLTLMIYMAADNDLESYALANLKEIEKALIQEVNVLLLKQQNWICQILLFFKNS